MDRYATAERTHLRRFCLVPLTDDTGPGHAVTVQAEPATQGRTIDEVLRERVSATPDRIVFTFCRYRPDGTCSRSTLTFAELDRRVEAAAAALAACGPPGRPVLLVHPPGLEFVVAFFACVRAGLVAVPTSVPQGRRGAERLTSIVASAGVGIATSQTGVAPAERLRELVPGLHLIMTDALPQPANTASDTARWTDIALLQYTSGSTTVPKGVIVTHQNILHNQRTIAKAFDHSAATTIVSWLPHFHDMGLACLLQAVYCGSHTVLFPAVQFMSDPARWLRAISEFSATTSGAPNFGYALAAELPESALAGIDLSSWRVAFNGSEPVRASTIRQFARAHRGRGFRSDAMLPCFGLAESTLLVTSKQLGAEPTILQLDPARLRAGVADDTTGEDHVEMVGSGVARDQRVVVVDANGHALADNHVGEIWVNGRSVGAGYYGLPGETAVTFGAQLESAGADRFLRTGDLGFLRAGQLFVSGRLKDVIILHGANHYPQDIEATVAEAHSDIIAGRVIAFGGDGTEEWLTIVCECRRGSIDTAAIAAAIVHAVTQTHGVTPGVVVLATPGTVPTTTSGKLRRGACQSSWRAGELTTRFILDTRIAQQPPDADSVGEWITQYLNRLAGQASTPATLAAGDIAGYLDSLQALTFCRDLEAKWRVHLELADLLELRSVGELLTLVNGRVHNTVATAAGDGTSPAAHLEQDDSGYDRTGPFPLSHSQQGIWYLDQHAAAYSAWTIRRAFRVTGMTDYSALADAFDALVARHPALRTTLVAGETVRQQIRPSTPCPLHVWETPVPAEELPVLPRIDPYTGPLLRADLLATTSGEHVLVIQVHHLAVDLWSAHTLLTDLDIMLRGDTELPSPPRMSYRDYASTAPTTSDEPGLSYWAATLDGASPTLGLAVVNDPPTYGATHAGFVADPALHAKIEALGQLNAATPYMVYLAAFSLVLAQQTGRSDIVLGSPVSTRTKPELWDVVGCFMQPGAVRVQVPPQQRFVDLLQHVRRRVIDGLANAGTSAQGLAANLDWDRQATPEMFDAVLLWQQTAPVTGGGLAAAALGPPGSVGQTNGITWELLSDCEQAPRFKLELSLRPHQGRLIGTLAGDSRYVSARFARLIVQRFESVLRAATDDPGSTLAAVMRSPAPQVEEAMRWGSPPPVRDEPETTLHGLMHNWARSHPDQIAVEFRERRLDYRTLAQTSRRGAEVLRASEPAGRMVAVLMEDGPALATTLFAVLEAGDAFVCPGTDTPLARVQSILDEASICAAIVDEATELSNPALLAALRLSAVPVFHCAPSGALSPDMPVSEPSRVPIKPVNPRSAAFVAYTSGSSGVPKGVVQTHEAFARFLNWQSEEFQLRPGRRIAHWSASTYDAAYCEILGALCHGATVWMAPKSVRHDPHALLMAMRSAAVHVWQVVPSFLAQVLAESGIESALPDLTHIFCAGEVLPPSLAAQVHRLLPGVTLSNLYGPTESVLATHHRVTAGDVAKRAIPLGTPIPGRELLVLDERLKPVPIGVVGEVHLVSAMLATGYLSRPALTAEAFVPAPTVAGDRMYRTGDLARWTAEGELLFCGRKDEQVKVRGMRVELGEIEAVLARHSSVSRCAVRTRNAGAMMRLEAHVVAGAPTTEQELRTYLARYLPHHMIPGRIRLAADLPMTRTGKIDRAALPEPPRAAVETLTAPDTRSWVARLWERMLGVEVGAGDDFFALGGQSIDAMRTANRVRLELSIDLPLKALFDASTLEGYAATVQQARISAALASPDITQHIRDVLALTDAEVTQELDRLRAASPAQWSDH